MERNQNVGEVFDALTASLLELTRSEYLNLGYWTPSTFSMQDAQKKLVELFGSFSELKPDLEVLDLGCGSGAQDFYFMERFCCKSILGVNASKVQVEMALKKIKSKPDLYSRINFENRDANNFNLYSDCSFDRVLALESSQYFAKNNFVKEAARVLRKGGILSIAEPIYNENDNAQIAFPDIRGELCGELREEFGDALHLKFLHSLDHMNNLRRSDSFKEKHFQYDPLIKKMEEEGMFLCESKDITENVLPFYAAFKAAILEKLKQNISSLVKAQLIHLLMMQFLNHWLFKNRVNSFYLIRAIKR